MTEHRIPRFAELDRLIAEDDAREAAGLPPTAKSLKHRARTAQAWAEKRRRCATCPHEKWREHGIQIMCLNCGKTSCRWQMTATGPRPL